jgi:hypothetical protein
VIGDRNRQIGDRPIDDSLCLLAVSAEDVLHPIFQLELAFLEGDFFELFGFGEVMLARQFM